MHTKFFFVGLAIIGSFFINTPEVFADTTKTGTISANETWSTGGGTYIIDGTVTVGSGVTVTVDPGVVVKFKTSSSNLTLTGTLNAQGSSSSPIYFTSYKDDTVGGDTNGDGSATTPGVGNWRYIYLNSGSTANLAYAVVRYGGNNSASSYRANIYNSGGTLTVATSTIAYADTYGIRQANGTTVVSGSVLKNNGTYGAYNALTSTSSFTAINNYWGVSSGPYHPTMNPSGTGEQISSYISFIPWLTIAPTIEPYTTKTGTISLNETWDTSVGVYVVDGVVTVGATSALTIKSGVVVKFKTATSSLVVDGTLDAQGATSDAYKIYFTSYKDDTVGGDTNGDGSATTPGAGDWNGILVDGNGTARVKSGRISYGGYNGSEGRSTQFYNDGGHVVIESTEIATGTENGIFNAYNGVLTQITVITSDIHGHEHGIYTNTNHNVTISSNYIHDNSSYGLYNFSFFNVDAKYNYWGSSTGPYNASQNSSGTGNAVSNDVDFKPYLAELHYLWRDDNGLNSGVDANKRINYDIGTTTYTTAWYGAVNTWNTYGNSVGGVTIATSTGTSTLILKLEDLPSDPSSAVVGQYFPLEQKLVFNPYYMQNYTLQFQQNVTTHELGHALGLWHSYFGNMMNSYVTGTTTLEIQDKSDYDYCWAGNNSVCRQ